MHFLTASMPPPSGLEDLFERFLPYQALGLAVVLFALTILFWICAITGRFFAVRSRPAQPVESKPAAPQPAPPIQTSTGEDARVIAAIAAAVSVALENHNHSIVDIAPAAKLTPMTSAWAIEGRFQHFSSHKFR
jgi:Na+-transporting methylmalonyl-CoA/oxaloacetate decarboxylase gamma subunit